MVANAPAKTIAPTIPLRGSKSPATPYYHLVPKGLKANLRFRRKMIRLGRRSKADAAAIRKMCEADPLFWFNTFAWTYDPRKPKSAIPFITYPFQDDAILQLCEAVGSEDILFEKSRDMGASWINVAVLTWFWHFRSGQSFLMVSRNEDYVDKAGNPKALFWKLDFLLEREPHWLKPKFVRNRLHIRNLDNGSVIDGESTTGDVGRGDRRTAILLDEFSAFAVDDGYKALAATGDTTRCRIFNFTPQGTGNAAYEMATSKSIRKIRMHWSQHPEKAEGLWVDDEGRLRSPWYDRECERRPIPMLIAQELDIDYLGSSHQFYDAAALDQRIKTDTRPPFLTGEIEYDSETGEPAGFVENPNGRLKLWIHLDAQGRPPRDREYVIGGDIATGTGSSNSCLAIGDRQTREKIGEFVSPTVQPHELAKIAVALGRWLNGAYLIWEANGPGRIFGNQVMELGYRNVYYRSDDRKLTPKTSDVPGWYSTRENKLGLLGEHRRAIGAGDYTDRSEETLKECKEYVFHPTGAVEHSRSTSTVDPTGARDNHGDRVIATALMWRALKVRKETKLPTNEPPRGSFEWRRRRAQAERQRQNYW